MKGDFLRGLDETRPDENDRSRNADGLFFGYGPWDQCDCGAQFWWKNGFDRYGTQRWICSRRHRTIRGHRLRSGVFDQERAFNLYRPIVNKLPNVIGLLCSGKHSIRKVAKLSGVNVNTVSKILHSLEAWLRNQPDLQQELGISIPVKCQCGQPLSPHKRVCKHRRSNCRPKSLGVIG